MKKILSILLTVCMLLGLFPFVLFAHAETDFTGYTAIGTWDELAAVMGDNTLWGGKFYLTADITAPTGNITKSLGTVKYTASNNTYSGTPFTGTFDGNGHSITVPGRIYGDATTPGLFGYVRDGAVIKNLTLTVDAAEKQLYNGSAVVGMLVGLAIGDVTIENCTTKGSIKCTASNICGYGAFIGRALTKKGVSITIRNCKNEAKVTGYKNVGGFIGLASGASSGDCGPLVIENCQNDGAITAGAGNEAAAGFIGLVRAYTKDWAITDCLNTGTITVPTKIAAGFTGRATDTSATGQLNFTRCVNLGTVSSAAETPTFIRAIAATSAARLTFTGCYYYDNNTYTTGDSPAGSDGTKISSLDAVETDCAALKAADAWVIANGFAPELKTFHTEHAAYRYTALGNEGHKISCRCGEVLMECEAHDDETCSLCGWVTTAEECKHETTRDDVKRAATCTVTGIKDVYCANENCGLLLEENVVIPLDSNNHASTAVSMALTAGNIVYTHTCCGAVTFTDTTKNTTVYVGGENAADPSGDMTAPLGTETAPFASFVTAMNYAALQAEKNNADVTVTLLGTVSVPATYATPASAHTITVTGGTLALNNRFCLNGPMVIENIEIAPTVATVIAARCHKLVLGEGITMSGGQQVLVCGGFENTVAGTVPASGYATDLTIRSGVYTSVYAANRMPSAVSGSWSTGTAKLTIGKTNASDTLTVTSGLCAVSSGSSNDALKTADITITVDGEVNVTGTLYMDSGSAPAGACYNTDLVLLAPITGPAAVNTNTTTATNGSATVYADLRVEGTEVSRDAILALNTVVKGDTYYSYCLKVNGEHFDGDDEDELCDNCGANLGCQHESTRQVITAEPTCSTKGSADIVCNGCSTVVDTVELELDPNNHEDIDFTWKKDANGYYLDCTACGNHAETGIVPPTLYVAMFAVGDFAKGDDHNTGSAGAPLATLEEAINRVSALDYATIAIAGRYNLSADVTLPAWDGVITFTAANAYTDGVSPAGGIAASASKPGALLTLGGDAIFDDVAFLDVSQHAGFKIVGDWHNVTFGDIYTYDEPSVWFVAGKYEPTAADTTEDSVEISMLGTTNVRGEAGVVFTNIYLGDYVKTNKTEIAAKTVNFTVSAGKDSEAHLGTINMMSACEGRGSSANAVVKGGSTTVTLNDATAVDFLVTTDARLFNATTFKGYLDSVTVNLNDNSTVAFDAASSGSNIINVKESVINVSTEADGRAVKVPAVFCFISTVDGTGGPQIVEGATATVNYGSHSFEKNAFRIPGAENIRIAVTDNMTDECDFSDSEFTMSDEGHAQMVYTCKCGKKQVEDLTVEVNTPEGEDFPTYMLIQTGKDEIALLSAVETFTGHETVGFAVTIGGATVTIGTHIGHTAIDAGTAVTFTAENFGYFGDGEHPSPIYGIRITGLYPDQMEAICAGEIEVTPLADFAFENLVD